MIIPEQKKELLEILEYFYNGLKDVEAASNEDDPMISRLEKSIKELKETPAVTVESFFSDGTPRSVKFKIEK